MYVNNKQLMPDTAHVLRDRQVLELGRDANNTQQMYYRFQYYVSAKVVTKDQTTGNLVDVEQRSSAAKNTVSLHQSHSRFLSPAAPKARDGRYCNAPPVRLSVRLSVTFSFRTVTQKRIDLFSRNFAGTCTMSWGCAV